MTENISGIT